MKWLLDTLVFLETQIFSQTERGCPFPMNRKIRSFGTPSFPFLWIHSIWKSETSSSLGIYFSRFHRISISLSIFPIKGFLVNTA